MSVPICPFSPKNLGQQGSQWLRANFRTHTLELPLAWGTCHSLKMTDCAFLLSVNGKVTNITI